MIAGLCRWMELLLRESCVCTERENGTLYFMISFSPEQQQIADLIHSVKSDLKAGEMPCASTGCMRRYDIVQEVCRRLGQSGHEVCAQVYAVMRQMEEDEQSQ